MPRAGSKASRRNAIAMRNGPKRRYGKALRTAGAQAREIPMILRERVFQLFWRPEVMFILMLVAIYGIIGELSNPGAIVPGVVGVIALIVVLYMAAVFA